MGIVIGDYKVNDNKVAVVAGKLRWTVEIDGVLHMPSGCRRSDGQMYVPVPMDEVTEFFDLTDPKQAIAAYRKYRGRGLSCRDLVRLGHAVLEKSEEFNRVKGTGMSCIDYQFDYPGSLPYGYEMTYRFVDGTSATVECG